MQEFSIPEFCKPCLFLSIFNLRKLIVPYQIDQMVSFDFIYALVAPYIVSNLTASCFCNEHVFVLITIDKKSEIFSCFK